MNNSPQSDQHRKVMALMLCLFLGFVYVESIWKPYFQGQRTPAPVSTPSANGSQSALAGQNASSQNASSQSNTSLSSAPAQAALNTSIAEEPLAGAGKYPSDAIIKEAGTFKVKTENLLTEISLLGGRVVEHRLREHLAVLAKEKTPRAQQEKLNLIRHAEHDPLPLGVYSGSVDDSQTLYRLTSAPASSGGEEASFSIEGDNSPASFVLEGELPDGRIIKKTLIFQPEGYFFEVDVELSAPGSDSSRVALEWTNRMSEEDQTAALDYYDVKGFAWFNDQKAIHEAFSDLSEGPLILEPVRWFSMEEKYFVSTLLSKGELAPGIGLHHNRLYSTRLLGSETAASFSIYAGPKSYEGLKEAGYELQRNIQFGWTGFIAAPLLLVLQWFYALFGNYGVAIVALTILVRTLFYPLNATSFKSMKAMQDLKPEIDRIKEQVKDKQQQQLELMGIYKKHGVNPVGGCLPVLLQMPIFIGLYSALMLAIELRHAPFALWIVDLSAPEKLMIGGVGIPVMVILFVASMMIQQWTTPTQMDPVQKRVMMFMPLVMGFLFMNMPAGLTLYWLTNNVISIGQQTAMYKFGTEGSKKALMTTLAVAAGSFVIAFILSFTARG